MQKEAAELVMRCFHARTLAHVMHLRTTSYAQHKALNEFYDEIIEPVDQLAEALQGEYGVIEDYPKDFVWFDDPLKMLDDLLNWLEQNRDEVCDDSYCQNIIDGIVALIRTTQYKLKNLK
jgi:hypothetical protein